MLLLAFACLAFLPLGLSCEFSTARFLDLRLVNYEAAQDRRSSRLPATA